MTPTIPSSIGCARLRQTPAGLSITIPPQGNWFHFFYFPVAAALVLGAVIEMHEDSAVTLVVIAALVAFSLRRWWRGVVGQQVITINKAAITVRSNVGFFGRQQNYFVSRISELGFQRVVTNTDLQAGLGNSPAVGTLAFSCESTRHTLAGRFTEAEAHELIALLETFSGAPLARIQTAPDRPLPAGMIAEELHRGRGGLLLYGMFGLVIYIVGVQSNDILPLRILAGALALACVAVGIMAEFGYRYRFTAEGLEISTVGFRLRFIPANQIVHYEAAKWTPGDRWNFGIFGRHRSFIWGGPGVRIETIDGSAYLGHDSPQKIVAHLDQMKLGRSVPIAQSARAAAN